MKNQNILVFRETDKETKEENLLAVFTDEIEREEDEDIYYSCFTIKGSHSLTGLKYLLHGNDEINVSIVKNKKDYKDFIESLQNIYSSTDIENPVKLIVLNDLFEISYTSDVNSLEINYPNKCGYLSLTKQILNQLKPNCRTIEVLPFYKICDYLEIKHGLNEGSLSEDLDKPYNRFQYNSKEYSPIMSFYEDYKNVVIEEDVWDEVSDNFKNALILLNSEYDLSDFEFDLSC
jgi:hypothetical protein